jgi:anti-sigma-K factor RskA
MTPEDCEDYQELLTAKALTALDAEGNRLLDAHLRSCANCRLEMGQWEETAAFLALEAAPLEPSPQVRERILASVRAEGRAKLTRNGAEATPDPNVVPRDSNVLAFERPPRNVWSSFGSFGAIAAILVFAALIISLLMLWQQNQAIRAEVARLSAQLDREHALVQLLTSPDGHMAKLTGTEVAPAAHAMLAYDKDGQAMLMAKGLPAAPAGKAYQLWYIVGGKPMPGKMLAADPEGNAMLEDQIPAAARSGAVFAVTLEPEGGMQLPTGAIYLRSAA